MPRHSSRLHNQVRNWDTKIGAQALAVSSGLAPDHQVRAKFDRLLLKVKVLHAEVLDALPKDADLEAEHAVLEDHKEIVAGLDEQL